MIHEKITLNKERNVTLTTYVQDVGGEFGENFTARPAMIVLPGGGYEICSDREAEPVALAYLKAGFQAFILRYSVHDHKLWPNPLNDYEQAIELIKKNKDIWHVDTDKISVIGFSAGGHLAAMAATTAKNKPDAAIIGYGALSSDICKSMHPTVPTPAELVNEQTCPCFLFAASDDRVVDISNSLDFANRLCEFNINFEMHIYSHGQHGFSIGDEYITAAITPLRLTEWVKDSIAWLGDVQGKLTSHGFDKPVINRISDGNREKYLSTSCTVEYLLKQSHTVQRLIEKYLNMLDTALAPRNLNTPGAKAIIYHQYMLKEILKILNIPDDVIDGLNEELNKIPNSK